MDVDVVEAHGTGTRLGDPIEAQALLSTYGQGRSADRPLWLGSVKSNIGHAQAAAGMAGVVKMVLALGRGVLPRTLHVDAPSSRVDWSVGAVSLLDRARLWPEVGRVRRAGVSAFGVSGTNAHVILEEFPGSGGVGEPGVFPVVLSGRVEGALREGAGRVAAAVDGDGGEVLVGDVAAVMAARSVFEHRAVVVAADRGELVAGLRCVAGGESHPLVVCGVAGPVVGGVVLVFPGQGSQWVGMARGLLASSEVFAARFGECERALAGVVDWSLSAVVDDAEALARVDVVQPVLWAVMVSLAAVWESLGVTPSVVVGHSQGEIAAACVAGILSLADGARVVASRSRLLVAVAGRGAMASVAVAADVVRGQLPEGVVVAAVNGPSETVVSGDPAAVDVLVRRWTEQGLWARRIAVDYASHSPVVDDVRDELLGLLSTIRPCAGRVPMVSTVTGRVVDGAGLDAGYWFENVRRPVLFAPVIADLASEHRVFVECSPHPVLVMAVQDSAEHATVTGTLRRHDGSWQRMLLSAAELFTTGTPITWPLPTTTRHLDLPTYPFQ
ncbi:acyltransferase domain-containing protein, partial [Micromonospora wenchangensis]|uniref:acyltransferase domain-containing protein n=1 Tax=Micromonospora wenchangensis TaxID=1185415 RepID=UPI003D73D1FA